MAVGRGFEPRRHLAAPYRFSKPASSATWVTHRILYTDSYTCVVHYMKKFGKSKKIFILMRKKSPLFLEGIFLYSWRRDRDSNPGWVAPWRFSRPLHSTALPSLRECGRHCMIKGYFVKIIFDFLLQVFPEALFEYHEHEILTYPMK